MFHLPTQSHIVLDEVLPLVAAPSAAHLQLCVSGECSEALEGRLHALAGLLEELVSADRFRDINKDAKLRTLWVLISEVVSDHPVSTAAVHLLGGVDALLHHRTGHSAQSHLERIEDRALGLRFAEPLAESVSA